MNKWLLAITFSVLLLVPVGTQNAFAAVITFISSDDTYLNSAGPDSNFNGQTTFASGTTGALIARGVVAFDVSSIPAGTTITDVQLKLTTSIVSGPPIPLSLQKITTGWDESTVTWNSPWITPGGDFLVASSATQTITVLDTYTWGSTGQMVNDVQGWVDVPSTNHGWLLKRADENLIGFARFFHNTQSPPDVPMLIVTFNAPAAGGVGGEYFSLDTTALLLAGMQTNLALIIPVLAAAGIGAVLIRKKF